MLIFRLEARTKKYLRLRIAEIVEKINTKEKNEVIGFIPIPRILCPFEKRQVKH
jgi:hypothetical protein